MNERDDNMSTILAVPCDTPIVLTKQQSERIRKQIDERRLTMESKEEIARRASLRKSNPNLRHFPNSNDIRIASEHAEITAISQYQSITSS